MMCYVKIVYLVSILFSYFMSKNNFKNIISKCIVYMSFNSFLFCVCFKFMLKPCISCRQTNETDEVVLLLELVVFYYKLIRI